MRLGGQIEKTSYAGNTVSVLVGNVTQVSVGAMSYANSLGNDVIAMHVSTEETKVKDAEVDVYKRQGVFNSCNGKHNGALPTRLTNSSGG